MLQDHTSLYILVTAKVGEEPYHASNMTTTMDRQVGKLFDGWLDQIVHACTHAAYALAKRQ